MYMSTPQPTIAMKNKDRAMIALRTDEFIAKGGKIQVFESPVKAKEVISEVRKRSRVLAANSKKKADNLRLHRS